MARNNTVTLIGNLGNEPHQFTSENGNRYIGLNICTTDSYQNESGEWVNTKPQWFFVSILGEKAQGYARNFRKGQRVKITGQLSSYQAPIGNGNTEFRLSVIGRKIELAPLPKRSLNGTATATDSTDAESVTSSPSRF